MIKIRKTRFPYSGHEIAEMGISVEEACRLLHSVSLIAMHGKTLVCESDDDQKQLVKTYCDMYRDEFNVRHYINEEKQMDSQVAYPATMDVFYADNFLFRFEAGIRKLNPSINVFK